MDEFDDTLYTYFKRYYPSKNKIEQKYSDQTKTLTTKQIESFGFVFLEKSGNQQVFVNKSKFGRDEKIHFGEIHDNKRYIAIENNCGQFYFMGWIKNKKELENLLSQKLYIFFDVKPNLLIWIKIKMITILERFRITSLFNNKHLKIKNDEQ